MRGVSERRVRRWGESGKMCAIKSGSTWRISLNEEPVEVIRLREATDRYERWPDAENPRTGLTLM